MHRLPLVCLLLAACGDDGPTGVIEAHATHYDYTFDTESRVAHAEVTMKVDTGGNCITLPLRATITAGFINGDGVDVAVAPPTAEFCGSGYDTGSTITVGADLEIPLVTAAPTQVGYSITRDRDGNDFHYLLSWVGGCDRFGPCDGRPDQFATYTFNVTHPEGWSARCPGAITEVSATQTKCDFTFEGGPTYSGFGVAAYPAWTQTDLGSWDGVQVTLYDRASTKMAAAIDVPYHTSFMAWMQSQFGAYPYGAELRVLTAPTYWRGFEHPGNIVLKDNLAITNQTSYLHETGHVLDHEITHMWAGDQTTIASERDFAWKEATAEYLPYVYEAMEEPAAALATVGYWKSIGPLSEFYPVPLEDPMPDIFDFYGDSYGPGPMILYRQLEVLSSRAQVLAGLQMVLGAQRALTVAELAAALEASTGLELDAYFDAWFRGTGKPAWPRYNVTFTAGSGTSSLQLTQMNKGPKPMGCKFHVALRGAQMNDEVLVLVDTFHDGVDQTLSIPTPAFTVTDVVLDPNVECLVYANMTSPRVIDGTNTPRVSSPFNTPFVTQRW